MKNISGYEVFEFIVIVLVVILIGIIAFTTI